MTARPGNVKPEGKTAPEQSERLLRMLVLVIEGYEDLARKVGADGDAWRTGLVAGACSMLRAMAATMDIVAAGLNERNIRSDLHAVRESTGGETPKVEQMSLLREEG